MITATYVMVKNAFSSQGVKATLGVKMFGFTWAVVACLLLSFFLLCCSCVKGVRNSHHDKADGSGSSSRALNRESSFERTYDNDKPGPAARSGRGFFHVSRKREEPPVFYENEAQQPAVQPAHVVQ